MITEDPDRGRPSARAVPLRDWPRNTALSMRAQLKRGIHALRRTGELREKGPHRDEMMLVQPEAIGFHMLRETWRDLVRRTGHEGGTFADGDWDRHGLERMVMRGEEVFRSCHDRWVLGRRWEETEVVRGYIEKLENGVPNRFANRSALMDRYRNLDAIFETVSRTRRMSDAVDDLVKVSVGRDEVLAWGPDGRHRICIAMIAGLERMPVRVGFVHVGALDAFQEIRTHKVVKASAPAAAE